MSISLSDHFGFRRLLRFVLPTIIMMIVTSVYSIVDGFFVSNIVGKNAFAAVNLIMPVLMALGSFGFMIGTGGSALIAKTLGEGKRQKANEYFTMLIEAVVVMGILLSALGFAFMRPIAAALGANAAIIDDCVLYGRTLIVGNTFFMLQNSFQSFLVTAEKPKMGLGISVIAGLTNIVLDFLLIYLFKMGVFGAALATIISQTAGGLVPLLYFSRKNTSLLCLVKAKPDFHALGQACLNGSSEMLTNLSTSVVGMLYNFQLIRIAAENGVAAYGVIMYVNFVFMGFFFGYAIGSAPIIGYHYGAQNIAELKNLFRKSLIITAVTAIIMTVSGILLATPLARLFVGYDAELLAMTATGMRLYALSFLLCGFNIFGSAFFTALNNGPVSALISFLRTLVIQVAAILILPMVLGMNGIWLAIAVAEGLTVIVTAFLFVKYRKKYEYA
ncbi:MATE family efflux transporter [Oscillibacter sp.]|uniref:MATE family efflux transporter n=1 Tax=Oscillibacter sp. TaxID=1945593 RepID=UPI0026311CCC|nr:MATE family efflux transporter [Oscillibacter sp.]MDD3346700.1 MATE family efflux transporter [Oscillibacter sp.]